MNLWDDDIGKRGIGCTMDHGSLQTAARSMVNERGFRDVRVVNVIIKPPLSKQQFWHIDCGLDDRHRNMNNHVMAITRYTGPDRLNDATFVFQHPNKAPAMYSGGTIEHGKELGPGDIQQFDGTQPHRGSGNGPELAVALFASCGDAHHPGTDSVVFVTRTDAMPDASTGSHPVADTSTHPVADGTVQIRNLRKRPAPRSDEGPKAVRPRTAGLKPQRRYDGTRWGLMVGSWARTV